MNKNAYRVKNAQRLTVVFTGSTSTKTALKRLTSGPSVKTVKLKGLAQRARSTYRTWVGPRATVS